MLCVCLCVCLWDAVGSMAGILIPLSSLACTCEANVSTGFWPDKRVLLFPPRRASLGGPLPLLRFLTLWTERQTKIEGQSLRPKKSGRRSGIPDSHAEEQSEASPVLDCLQLLS